MITVSPRVLLGVRDQRVVGRVEEGDVRQLAASGRCSRRISLSRAISGSSGAVERALLELVLLGVQVLLGALAERDVLDVLEARVDPVARAERRGEHEPRLERRAAAVLEVGVQDVGRVGEEVGAEVLLLAGVGELGDVLGQLPARVLPGEVRVGLAEAELAEVAHHARCVNASARKITSRSRAWTCSISHAQNANGFVCGLSTRNTLHAAVDPAAARPRAARPTARASPASPS